MLADTIQLSCGSHKKVEMSVVGDDVKLKINDLAPYPGLITSGYATVIKTTDSYAVMYKISDYLLRKKKNGYTLLQGDDSDLKLDFCDITN